MKSECCLVKYLEVYLQKAKLDIGEILGKYIGDHDDTISLVYTVLDQVLYYLQPIAASQTG